MSRSGSSRLPLVLLLLVSVVGPALADEPLNVSIVVFDPGVPDTRSMHRDLKIFPRIRAVEAMLLPFRLREVLAGTGEWGAVRVVRRPDEAAELSVSGEILHSDGLTSEIRIRAVDASGQPWIDSAYAGAVGDSGLFDRVARDLRSARTQYSDEYLLRIEEISLLRRGSQLAPSAFAGYLDVAEDGRVEVQRLPSRNDPMFDRIRRIREAEFVITDAVDEKFRSLYEDISSVYDLWHEYQRETVRYEAMDAERAAAKASAAPDGSYEDLLNQYENYKYHRVTQQEQDRLAVAFDNEVGPAVEGMELRVRALTAWISNKQSEWYRLLEELFDAETSDAKPVDPSVVEEINRLPQ